MKGVVQAIALVLCWVSSIFVPTHANESKNVTVTYPQSSPGAAVLVLHQELRDEADRALVRPVVGDDFGSTVVLPVVSGEVAIEADPGLYEVRIRGTVLGFPSPVNLWTLRLYLPEASPLDADELAARFAPIVVFYDGGTGEYEREQYAPRTLAQIFDATLPGVQTLLSRTKQSLKVKSPTSRARGTYVAEPVDASRNEQTTLREFLQFNSFWTSFIDVSLSEVVCDVARQGCEPVFLRGAQEDGRVGDPPFPSGFDFGGEGAPSDSGPITLYYDVAEVGDRIHITYWFFYPFDSKLEPAVNPGNADFIHILDRESLTVTLNAADRSPISVTYGAHTPSQKIRFRGCVGVLPLTNQSTCDIKPFASDGGPEWSGGRAKVSWRNALRVDQHPVAYIAKGAHAIYPTVGMYGVVTLGAEKLIEPAGSPTGRQTFFPSASGEDSEISLLPLDWMALADPTEEDDSGVGVLAFGGGMIESILPAAPGSPGANIFVGRFPPFAGRVPYSDWVSEAPTPFEDCLSGANRPRCLEVRRHFDSVVGLGRKGVVPISVVKSADDPSTPSGRSTVVIEDVNGTVVTTGRTDENGKYLAFVERSDDGDNQPLKAFVLSTSSGPKVDVTPRLIDDASEARDIFDIAYDVPATAPPPSTLTVSISASPTLVGFGQSTTITWESTNAEQCTGRGFATDGDVSGTVEVRPRIETTYSVTCEAGSDTASAETNVSVASDARYLTFQEGNPNTPNDGTTISGAREGDAFFFLSRFRPNNGSLSSALGVGFTLSVYISSDATRRRSATVDFGFKDGTGGFRCEIKDREVASLFNNEEDTPPVNGRRGVFTMFRTDTLLFDFARMGCRGTLDDVVIISIVIRETVLDGGFTATLDAAAIGAGFNSFPNSTTPPP